MGVIEALQHPELSLGSANVTSYANKIICLYATKYGTFASLIKFVLS